MQDGGSCGPGLRNTDINNELEKIYLASGKKKSLYVILNCVSGGLKEIPAG